MFRRLAFLICSLTASGQNAPILLGLTYEDGPGAIPWVQIVVSDQTSAFEVLRSTVRGGPYVLIGSSPQPFADTCGIGCYRDVKVRTGLRYYYVVRNPGTTALSPELSAVMPGPAASPVGPPD